MIEKKGSFPHSLDSKLRVGHLDPILNQLGDRRKGDHEEPNKEGGQSKESPFMHQRGHNFGFESSGT